MQKSFLKDFSVVCHMYKCVKITFPGAAKMLLEVSTIVGIKLNESKALPACCAVCGSRFLLQTFIPQDTNQTVANKGLERTFSKG